MKAKFKPINWKLKTKVIFHIFVIGLIAVIGLTMLYLSGEKDLIETMTEQKTELVSNMIDCNVRHQMTTGEPETIPLNLERLTESSSIARLRILDLDGVILSSSQQGEIGSSLPPGEQADLKRIFVNSDPTDLFTIKPVSHAKSYIALRNRTECAGCHAPDQPFNGILEVQLDESLEAVLLKSKRSQGTFIALATLIILVFVIFRLYERVINRPLQQLKDSMREVERGDLDIKLEPQKLDEFGDLAQSFNHMVQRLKQANQQIAELHEKQIERAGHLASLGELAAGLAHEIKNPIAGIKGSLEIIRDRTAEDDPQHEIFTEILKQTGKIYHIIQDLLDYAKPKELNIQPVEPNAWVREAIRMAEAQTMDKDIRFGFTGLEEEQTVLCDPDKLQGVILNLLLNSIAFIDTAGEIDIRLNKKPDDMLEVRIVDTGAGIKPANLGKIFQPFFTTRKQGTGLGLSICRQIVEAHRGHITVESSLGEGTTVALNLPLDPPGK